MTYSSQVGHGRSRFAKVNQNTTTFHSQSKAKLGPVSNTIVLTLLICLLGMFYLTQVSKTNTLGYSIDDLNTKQSELTKQHDELQVSSARLKSLNRVSQSDAASALVSSSPSATISN
ncbi:MAG: hypothetical protein M3P98_03790 [bacterium]|nr:hypothetical protein [bacterium]